MSNEGSFSSVGEIARRLGKPLHRVEYVVRSRGITPLVRAGGRNFYSEASVQRIDSEIRQIESDRANDSGDVESMGGRDE